MENQDFVALKVQGGFKVYRGEPDSVGLYTRYLTFKGHSSDVIDYCDALAKSYNDSASIHFDMRGV